MKLSLSEISTVSATFAEDVEAYAAAGFAAIGIWEFKLPADDDANLALLAAAGLAVSNCSPAHPSILPNAVIEGPDDPEERIELLCESVRRLARYRPSSVVCLTGAAGGTDEGDARRIVIDGLRRVAAVARESGVRLGLEPIHASQRDDLSLITTIPEALALLAEAGLADVGVMIDAYHVWDTPDVLEHLRANAARVTGLHVADWPPEPGRSDRLLPGEGHSRTRELVAALHEAGFDGYLDVEIFGDPDRPGSLWALPVAEAARRAYVAAVGVAP